jgi:Flp pilus assembly pilin Flp
MLKKLWNDEAGLIVSAELTLVLTIGVIAMVVGLSEVAVAVNTELNDVSNAFGGLNQSYAFSGFHAISGCKIKSAVSGSSFVDSIDDCDKNQSCDLVCGAPMGNCGEGGMVMNHW